MFSVKLELLLITMIKKIYKNLNTYMFECMTNPHCAKNLHIKQAFIQRIQIVEGWTTKMVQEEGKPIHAIS